MTETAKTPATETKTDKTPVTMTDGRVVLFTPKQKLVKESLIDAENGIIITRLDFRNGQTRSLTIPGDMILRFAAHGAEQKLGDAIAGEKDFDDAVLAVESLITRLEAGEWNMPREAGAFTGASILLRALVEVSGKSIEEIKTFLETKTAAEKLALRRSAKLEPTIKRLEAEKASKSKNVIDTDALLGDLLDEPIVPVEEAHEPSAHKHQKK